MKNENIKFLGPMNYYRKAKYLWGLILNKMVKITPKLIIILSIFLSCNKDEENSNCINSDISIGSIIIGQNYNDEFLHLSTFELNDEICIITKNSIKIYSYDTLKTNYEHFARIGGAFVTQFDTIVQIDNSFYRFYPTQRKFDHIFTPPFTIFDFCVTPSHGIGYIWGNIFVEGPKFNYFDFNLNTNKTLFEYAKLIPNSNQPYFNYQTFLHNDTLKLIIRTGNTSNASKGNYYLINLQTLQITDYNYTNKLETRIISYNDFENIDLKFELNEGGAEIATYNIKSGSALTAYKIKNNAWYDSDYFFDSEHLSISKISYNSDNKTEYINWKTGEIYFSINTPKLYKNVFVGIRHYKDKMVILYNQRQNTAIIYDKNGCIINQLLAKNNIVDIIYLDTKKVIILNDKNEIEFFKLD
ncbi:MAG: hypothetical protein H6567_05795 [Lewinellaceae bacterium]|nr:hypothetical protein [Lewinellaceae bacterium]